MNAACKAGTAAAHAWLDSRMHRRATATHATRPRGARTDATANTESTTKSDRTHGIRRAATVTASPTTFTASNSPTAMPRLWHMGPTPRATTLAR